MVRTALALVMFTVQACAGDGYGAALRCAARLMGEPAPTIAFVRLPGQPSPAECHRAGRETCGAISAVTDTLWVVKAPVSSPWWLKVHEACHVVQHASGRQFWGASAERECEAVQLRADLC